ncbi:MAG: ATP-binding protein [Candidatus Didemnitutus sp.]|nr:ATP-binding protein [Candidatus Didemnitutus sp.]
MSGKKSIFVSSVQKELAAERRALKDYIHGDPLLRQFFEVFLFEDLPATDRRADDAYLAEVDRSAIYLGLFGQDYGSEDASGLSPTEHEFDRATALGKPRFIYVRGHDDSGRHPKMQALIRRAGEQLIRRRFGGTAELNAAVYASLVDYLGHTGLLHSLPFDAAACVGATPADLAPDRLDAFLARAQATRGYALGPGTPMADALTHLNLLEAGVPNHAAILLFGTAPQRWLPTSLVKCLHFHGTEVRKPIPSHQEYRGTVFALVDQAVDFVMSKIDRRVGTRAEGNAVPVSYELPREAVAEAIVNAIAHRDYASNASVQVMLFSDRLEIWNPGELPAPLTPDRLTRPHASIPRNPLLAGPLFLAGYIEQAGTGTLDMIALSREAGLKAPEFRQDGGQFVQTLWRPIPTPTGQADGQVTTQVTTQDNLQEERVLSELAQALALPTAQATAQAAAQVAKILSAAGPSLGTPRENLQTAAGIDHREHFRKAYLEPLVTAGWLERTILEKPTSPHQKYRLTPKGRAWLDQTTSP